jgi:tetratricopeptide (TPR) repeat protein
VNGRQALAASAMALLAGCAGSPGEMPAREALYADAAFRPAVARPDAAQVFALSPAMQAYLERDIAPRLHGRSPQRALIDALYSGPRLVIDYDAELTRTAAEAFDARAGNCLSLVIMTGAFAKALGLAVRYQSVEVDHSWARDGDLALYMGHVNIAIGRRVGVVRSFEDSPDWWTVDFMSPPDARRLRTLPITEQRVVAMYFNNKAAEALAGGRPDDAYAWSRAAIEADPLYTDAYNTLGAVYLRRGLLPAAERTLRAALARRGDHPQALANLAIVWRRQGREAEALAVEERLVRLRALSPFATFERGRKAYEAGDFHEARELFRRALAVSNDYHEFHFWLALAQWQLGEDADALRHLRLAEENSLTRRQQSLYAMKQRWLQTHAGPGSAGAPVSN